MTSRQSTASDVIPESSGIQRIASSLAAALVAAASISVAGAAEPATFTLKHLTPESALKAAQAALAQCRKEKINPAAVAQVLGENAVMLMIRNFGPDAGKQYAKSLSEEAVRMAHFYTTQNSKKAE